MDLNDYRERLGKGLRHAKDLASGRKKWTMCVPVQDDDSDMLLVDAMRVGLAAVTEAERLRGELMQVVGHQEEPGEVCRPDCTGCAVVNGTAQPATPAPGGEGQ